MTWSLPKPIAFFAFSSLLLGSSAFLGCDSGGVGDPCIPEDEYREDFAGFSLSQENIESRSFQCQTRICLVNHFQGRVSCPLGQEPPTSCENDSECDGTETCTDAGVSAPSCDPSPCDASDPVQANCTKADGNNAACGNRPCNAEGGFCECVDRTDCPTAPAGYFCDNASGGPPVCRIKVCSKPQSQLEANESICYVPGTDVPISVPVCAQCNAASKRDADNAVYCSCRCGVAQGEEEDPNFNFCECPDTYECAEIRQNIGLGDAQITGKYCIKAGTSFEANRECGAIAEGGYRGPQCDGI